MVFNDVKGYQGGHKPGKLREFEKLSISGKFEFLKKNLENSGKM